MGMTIDEVIKALKWFLEYNEEDYEGDRFQDEYGDWFYKVSERDFEAFRQAVDTMRKHQKIEQIYQKWNEVNDFSYNQAMREIGEVLEDGTTSD